MTASGLSTPARLDAWRVLDGGPTPFRDDGLRAVVELAARRLSAAKLRRFGELSARWQLDGLPTPPSRAVEAGR